jgi:glycosyltransferase involved in cell wall biosynthesis
MKRVCYLYPPAYHYRSAFNELLREILLKDGIEYIVIYSDMGNRQRFKNDTVEIKWGVKVPLMRLPGNIEIQRGIKSAIKCDLVIMQQESKLVVNYLFNILSVIRFKKVAFFGHGKNFQSRNPNGIGEQFKRFWATKVDWWFGYTEETRRHVESLGFPSDRITIFNNAVDTSEVHTLATAVTPERLAERRAELEIENGPVGIFVGGIYGDKLISYLVAAADIIRARLPNFTLIVAGGGVDLALVEELAANRPWLKVLGPRFGVDKVELMRLSNLFLMPGLVGLAVLDAAAAGLPTVTTSFPYHSPEIAYIEDDVNGVVVRGWQEPANYADAVVTLLNDSKRLARITASAQAMSERYTVETMAMRFAAGVRDALAKPSR